MAGRPPLHALTGLRFVAALHVVIYHLWRFDAWDVPPALRALVATGPVAVTLFFVLSGFVLTYTYADGERLTTTKRAFWRARFARVYPVYALALLIVAPAVLVMWARSGTGSDGLVTQLVHGLFVAVLVQAWMPEAALAWNPPAWSLSAEAFFYAVFPFVALALLRGSRRRAVGVAALGWAASVAVSLLYLAADPDGLGAIDHASRGYYLDALKYHPVVRLPELLIGVVAARLFLEAQGRPVSPWWAALAALVTALVLGSGVVSYALWHNALLAPAFAALLLWCASSSAWLPRALAHPIMVRLGQASYALYILHVPLLYWIAGLGERRTGQKVLEEPAVAIASLLFVVLCSLAAYRWLEAPLRRILRG